MNVKRFLTEEQAQCHHMHFSAVVDIAQIEGQFVANIKIHCKDCGVPFSFRPPAIHSNGGPSFSADLTEIRLALNPGATGTLIPDARVES